MNGRYGSKILGRNCDGEGGSPSPSTRRTASGWAWIRVAIVPTGQCSA